MTLKDSRNATSLPGSVCGLTPCAAQDGPMIAPSGQDHAPASLSAPAESDRDLTIPAIIGPHGFTLLRSARLTLSLGNRLQAKTALHGSTLYRLIWKTRIMPSQVSISALRASVPRTSASASSGWPTPTANSWKHPSNAGREGGLNLQTAAVLSGWTTPSASDGTRGGTGITPGMSGSSLAQLVKLAGWPTPAATDGKGGYQGGRVRNGKLSTDRLDVTAQLAGWPTPNTCNDRNPRQQDALMNYRENGTKIQKRLQDLAAIAEPMRLTVSGDLLTGFSAGMESGGQLNPELALWLMGLPDGWASCAPTVMPSLRRSRKRS